jgi:hypothetical protein
MDTLPPVQVEVPISDADIAARVALRAQIIELDAKVWRAASTSAATVENPRASLADLETEQPEDPFRRKYGRLLKQHSPGFLRAIQEDPAFTPLVVEYFEIYADLLQLELAAIDEGLVEGMEVDLLWIKHGDAPHLFVSDDWLKKLFKLQYIYQAAQAKYLHMWAASYRDAFASLELPDHIEKIYIQLEDLLKKKMNLGVSYSPHIGKEVLRENPYLVHDREVYRSFLAETKADFYIGRNSRHILREMERFISGLNAGKTMVEILKEMGRTHANTRPARILEIYSEIDFSEYGPHTVLLESRRAEMIALLNAELSSPVNEA